MSSPPLENSLGSIEPQVGDRVIVSPLMGGKGLSTKQVLAITRVTQKFIWCGHLQINRATFRSVNGQWKMERATTKEIALVERWHLIGRIKEATHRDWEGVPDDLLREIVNYLNNL